MKVELVGYAFIDDTDLIQILEVDDTSEENYKMLSLLGKQLYLPLMGQLFLRRLTGT
jgi:hypothetical protein